MYRGGRPLEVLLCQRALSWGGACLFLGLQQSLERSGLKVVCLGTPTQLHEVWGPEETDRQTWLLVLGLEQGLVWFHIVFLFSPRPLYSVTPSDRGERLSSREQGKAH